MFHLDADLKVYLHREAVDFRKSINGLATLVEQSMGGDPSARAVYAFRNRGCDRIKLEEQFRLAQLKRHAPSSAKRSERVFNEAQQMSPAPQDSAVMLPDTGLPEVAPAAPQKRGRKPLPADLPRKRVEYDLSEDQKICGCCQGALHRIGEDINEQLHIPTACRCTARKRPSRARASSAAGRRPQRAKPVLHVGISQRRIERRAGGSVRVPGRAGATASAGVPARICGHADDRWLQRLAHAPRHAAPGVFRPCATLL